MLDLVHGLALLLPALLMAGDTGGGDGDGGNGDGDGDGGNGDQPTAEQLKDARELLIAQGLNVLDQTALDKRIATATRSGTRTGRAQLIQELQGLEDAPSTDDGVKAAIGQIKTALQKAREGATADPEELARLKSENGDLKASNSALTLSAARATLRSDLAVTFLGMGVKGGQPLEDAISLSGLLTMDIDFDDDGKPDVDVAELAKKTLETRPHLLPSDDPAPGKKPVNTFGSQKGPQNVKKGGDGDGDKGGDDGNTDQQAIIDDLLRHAGVGKDAH